MDSPLPAAPKDATLSSVFSWLYLLWVSAPYPKHNTWKKKMLVNTCMQVTSFIYLLVIGVWHNTASAWWNEPADQQTQLTLVTWEEKRPFIVSDLLRRWVWSHRHVLACTIFIISLPRNILWKKCCNCRCDNGFSFCEARPDSTMGIQYAMSNNAMYHSLRFDFSELWLDPLLKYKCWKSTFPPHYSFLLYQLSNHICHN